MRHKEYVFWTARKCFQGHILPFITTISANDENN